MRRWRTGTLVVLLPLVLIPERGCRVEGEEAVALAPEAAAAVAETPWLLLRFGTPEATPMEEEGLDVPAARSGETWADARRRVEIALRLDAVRPRVGVLDLASYDGVGAHEGAVLLNGKRVGSVAVRPERRRVRIALPPDLQRVGENRLAFRFRAASAPRPPAGHRYAARLFGLVVAEPSPALEALLAAAAPPFSFWPQGRELVQAGPSRLHWARPGPGSLLHVAAALHPASRAGRSGATLIVTASQGRTERELWRARVEPSAPLSAEAWVPLPEGAGAARLSAAVVPDDGSPVWVRWRYLELVDAAPGRSWAQAPAADPRRPSDGNVVLVVFDAARADHFGCYGYRRPTTPEVDRLAAEGALFERAYTPAVFTLSAMASLWTSRLPDEHHGGAAHDDALPAHAPTLAELLSAHGVRTVGFVGNGMAGRGFGLNRGFAEFDYVGYRAGDMRAALERWLARGAPGRFLLYVHYRQPHTPLDPPPPFDTRFGSAAPLPPEDLDRWLEAVNGRRHVPSPAELDRYRQLYDGNLAVADRELGWLRGRLEAAGLWDRSLVIVTADHGEALHDHGFIGHNSQLYEESVRIPLVVRFPHGAGPRGLRVATPVDLTDVAPTIAESLGVPVPAHAAFRGRSLLELAREGGAVREVLARSAGPRPLYALIDGRRKYIFNSRYGTEELYDLGSDPGEQRDLAAAEPVLASVYRQRMFRRLFGLPGRWTGEQAAWRRDARESDDLRALGYVR